MLQRSKKTNRYQSFLAHSEEEQSDAGNEDKHNSPSLIWSFLRLDTLPLFTISDEKVDPRPEFTSRWRPILRCPCNNSHHRPHNTHSTILNLSLSRSLPSTLPPLRRPLQPHHALHNIFLHTLDNCDRRSLLYISQLFFDPPIPHGGL